MIKSIDKQFDARGVNSMKAGIKTAPEPQPEPEIEPQIKPEIKPEPESKAQIKSERDQAQLKNESIKVLMVEDDDYYHKIVQCLLDSYPSIDFAIARAKCLSDTVEYLNKETPAVILLDLNLPDSKGLDTLSSVQQLSERVPIIVLTGSDDRDLGTASIVRGADDFLVKQNADTDSLVRSIRYSMLKKAEESRMRLLAIQDFIATLAHDLQIPMIGSNNVLDALIAGRLGALQPLQAQALVDLRESNNNQLKLVHKLIEIYRYEAGSQALDFEALHVDELIARSVQATRQESDTKQIRIVTNTAQNIDQIYGDSDAVSRLLINLIDNAIKYSEQGGKVEINAENSNGYVAIHVTNHGQLISAEEKTKLFSSFWTGVPGKKYVANIGLGLYLGQRIVMLHKGKIGCRSNAEEGTTFSITLPIQKVR